MDLLQMTTLIVGATGAIGSSLARSLAAKQTPLLLAGRDATALQALAASLTPTTKADLLHLDCAKPDEMAEQLKNKLPDDLAAVAYAVGSITLKRINSCKPSDFLTSFELNVVGAAETLRAAVPALKKNKGAAVLFSSVAARHGLPSHAVVSASKAAVEGLGLALAAELAPHVRVNVVAPSLTGGGSKMAAPLLSNEKAVAAMSAAHALGRLGEPDDAARAAEWLLSREASWVTGQILGVDGGRSSVLK